MQQKLVVCGGKDFKRSRNSSIPRNIQSFIITWNHHCLKYAWKIWNKLFNSHLYMEEERWRWKKTLKQKIRTSIWIFFFWIAHVHVFFSALSLPHQTDFNVRDVGRPGSLNENDHKDLLCENHRHHLWKKLKIAFDYLESREIWNWELSNYAVKTLEDRLNGIQIYFHIVYALASSQNFIEFDIAPIDAISWAVGV